MKGIILAGGKGSRLEPVTRIINKHLLLVYDEPMIYFPLRTLLEAGIEDIMVVIGEHNAGGVMSLLADGSEWQEEGLRSLVYAVQKGHGGIAAALDLARSFVAHDNVMVVLGDNILLGPTYRNKVKAFEAHPRAEVTLGQSLAEIFLYEVEDPERFGCPRFDADGHVVEIIEKPEEPPSQYAVIGVYLYTASIFHSVIPKLRKSARGELEITDANQYYLERGALRSSIYEGVWIDAGTPESLHKASIIVRQHKRSEGR